MAIASTPANVEKNPQTRCSICQTVFEVSRDLLASSDTRVRCGECLSIFDALDGLRPAGDQDDDVHDDAHAPDTQKANTDSPASTHEDAGAAVLAGLANDTAALDETFSDFDLFSEEADLPEIAYFDQTRETPEFDFDAIEVGDDETFSDTLFVHDVTINADAEQNQQARQNTTAKTTSHTQLSPADTLGPFAEVDFATKQTPREPLIFNYKDPEPEEEPEVQADPLVAASAASAETVGELNLPAANGGPWLFRSIMAVLLLALLAGLYGYRKRGELQYNPTLRPLLVSACGVLGCELPARVDMDALTVLKSNVYSHPNAPNALVINVSFRNDALFEQPYPVIVMQLSNQLGRVISKRDFMPVEYLDQWQPGDLLPARKQLDVSLEISEPTSNVDVFEFQLRRM